VLPGIAVEGAVCTGEVVAREVLPVAPVVLPDVAPVLAPIAPGARTPVPAAETLKLSTTLRLPENDSAIRRAMSLSRELGTDPES